MKGRLLALALAGCLCCLALNFAPVTTVSTSGGTSAAEDEVTASQAAHTSCTMKSATDNATYTPATGYKYIDSGTTRVAVVTSFTGLSNAVTAVNSSTTLTTLDAILSVADDSAASAEWTATSEITINAGKTVHIKVKDGEKITIKRGNWTGRFFVVNQNSNATEVGTLILGDGTITYTGEEGDNSVRSGAGRQLYS